jgi:hypothetical protein
MHVFFDMKTAAQSAEKFVQRASGASQDYADGAASTTKDQAAAAIAAKQAYQAGVAASIARGAFEKGLQKSGKAKWLKGVQEKGAARFASGVQAGKEAYAAESARYDNARNAAANLPRAERGSESNYNRSSAVGKALRAVKIAK